MVNLNEKFLSDGFKAYGNKQEDFEALIRMIDRKTKCATHSIKNLVLLSIDHVHDIQKQSSIFCALIDPQKCIVNQTIITENDPIKRLSIKRQELEICADLKRGDFPSVIEESINSTGILIFNKEISGREQEKTKSEFNSEKKENESSLGATFLFSEMALKTLAQRLFLTAKPLREKSLERDLFIARLMNRDASVTVVTKQHNGVAKIFAFLSPEYLHTKLFLICELYSLEQADGRFGKMSCVTWDITHKRALIRFSFEDYAEKMTKKYDLNEKLTPYVEYISSDTGESSLIVKSFWMTESGHYIPDRMFSRKHRGASEEAETIRPKLDEEIFKDFEKIPRELRRLKFIQISPEGFDPYSASWKAYNRNTILSAFRNILKKIDASNNCLGKNRKIKLAAAYDWIIKEDVVYTAYKLFMDIASIPAMIQAGIKDFPPTSNETLRKFREYCMTDAIKLDYQQVSQEAMAQAAKKIMQRKPEAPENAECFLAKNLL